MSIVAHPVASPSATAEPAGPESAAGLPTMLGQLRAGTGRWGAPVVAWRGALLAA
ncbi:MAG: hypothetical protein J7480_02585 [Microbacteriaceae bacterium]|nr:hypothetical protein [Microbacteriaceae bacterium]